MIASINTLEQQLVMVLHSMQPILSPTTFISVALTLALLVRHYYSSVDSYCYWSERGVPGPRPSWPLVGHMFDLLDSKRRVRFGFWLRRYGKVFGIYENSSRPVLVVADAETIRQIGIKDFEAFVNHELGVQFNELQERWVFLLQDDEWRCVRTRLSSAFTSGKMRRMFELMEVCAEDLVMSFGELLDQIECVPSGGVEVNLKNLFYLYTLDTIALCCFGIKLDRQRVTEPAGGKSALSPRHELLAAATKQYEFRTWRMVLAMVFGGRLCRWLGLRMIPEDHIGPLARHVERLVRARARCQSERRFDDYLQTLLDARKLDGLTNDFNHCPSESALKKEHSDFNGADNGEGVRKRPPGTSLDGTTILSSATNLLTVAIETTGILMIHCIYLLAFHPGVQERLHKVLSHIATSNACINPDTRFTYNDLSACPYLDSVICETLRLLPPAHQTDRVASRDYKLDQYGFTVSKGTKVLLLMQEVMRHPDYWPEADQFKPERFMPENRRSIVAGSYCPFGIGPRHCLGMRFGLIEAKLGLAKLVMRFKFEPAPGTRYPPELKYGTHLNMIVKPQVRALKR